MTISGFIGIDWGSVTHQACALSQERKYLDEKAFEHSGKGLDALANWATQVIGHPADEIAIAIEVPHGPVVTSLLMRGFQVFSVNPKQLDRFRGRFTVAGAKDDRRDARVLADSLRSDPEVFRAIALEDPQAIALQEHLRTYKILQDHFLRMANQLREQVWKFFPQVLKLSEAVTEPWVWDLLEKCPTPESIRKLPENGISRILKKHRISRVTAPEVRGILMETPIKMRADLPHSLGTLVRALLPSIRRVKEDLATQEKAMAGLIAQARRKTTPTGQYSDEAILLSMPGVGIGVLARILAYGSDSLRARNLQQLRAQAGVAPVTMRSGKSGHVSMRRACSPHLRFALYHWGFGAMRSDQHARDHYAALRARGKSHARAVRGVADRLLNVAIAMLKSGTIYQESRRKSLPASVPGVQKAAK